MVSFQQATKTATRGSAQVGRKKKVSFYERVKVAYLPEEHANDRSVMWWEEGDSQEFRSRARILTSKARKQRGSIIDHHLSSPITPDKLSSWTRHCQCLRGLEPDCSPGFAFLRQNRKLAHQIAVLRAQESLVSFCSDFDKLEREIARIAMKYSEDSRILAQRFGMADSLAITEMHTDEYPTPAPDDLSSLAVTTNLGIIKEMMRLKDEQHHSSSSNISGRPIVAATLLPVARKQQHHHRRRCVMLPQAA